LRGLAEGFFRILFIGVYTALAYGASVCGELFLGKKIIAKTAKIYKELPDFLRMLGGSTCCDEIADCIQP